MLLDAYTMASKKYRASLVDSIVFVVVFTISFIKLNFAVYHTPAENLCYTAAQKMVDRFGFKKTRAKGT